MVQNRAVEFSAEFQKDLQYRKHGWGPSQSAQLMTAKHPKSMQVQEF